MPRIARNIVEFTLRGITYRATFTHEHYSGVHTSTGRHTLHGKMRCKTCIRTPFVKLICDDCKGSGWVKAPKVLFKGADGKPSPVRHITTCVISGSVSGRMFTGVAACSLKDVYNWRKGIRESFVRAIAAYGVAPEADRKEWGMWMREFFTQMSMRAEMTATPVAEPKEGVMV